MSEICTQVDPGVPQARWIASLSDGITVFMDDYREGLPEWSSWKRLKKHCEDNNLYLTALRLQHRSHIIDIPDHKEGYFFINKLLAGMKSGVVKTQWGVGYIIDDTSVHVDTYYVPELEIYSSEIKSAEDSKTQISLIRKPQGA